MDIFQFSHVQLLRERYGVPLNTWSCYRYEDFYKQLRQSSVPGTQAVTAQIFNNVTLKRQLKKSSHRCQRTMRVKPARESTSRIEDR